MSSKYYIFNDMIEDSELGFRHSELRNLTRVRRVTWVWGERHSQEIPVPIEAELDPEYGTELLDSYHEHIPLWSCRLIEALRHAGVGNLDLYDAVIRDPRTGLETAEYRAVNIIGRIACADMERSAYDPRSENGAVEFTKLVIDPERTGEMKLFRLAERPTLIIVNEDVKQAIEEAQLRGIRCEPAGVLYLKIENKP